MTRLLISCLVVLTGCSGIFPICDQKDKTAPWHHPEHFPGTRIEEPAPIAFVQEAIEQLACKLGI
jgi:hypothetical protein